MDRRVHDEIEKHLTEARLVGVDARHRRQLPPELGTMSDLVPRHANGRPRHLLRVDRAASLARRSRERLQIADDVTNPQRRVLHVRELFPDRRHGRDASDQQNDLRRTFASWVKQLASTR